MELMEELVTLIKSGMDWKSYEGKFSLSNRPPKDLFAQFVARRLKDKLEKTPSTLSLRIVRSEKNHLFLAGSIVNTDGEDRIAGEVVWMPNLNNFRGHLLINPPSGEELQHEEIEELRKQEWEFGKWKPKNPQQTHDHCRLCWVAFFEVINSEGYTDGYKWVCPKCYVEHLRTPLATV